MTVLPNLGAFLFQTSLPTALLSAQVESYYLAVAIQLPFSLVLAGAAYALRRPAMLRLAWGYNLQFAFLATSVLYFLVSPRPASVLSSWHFLLPATGMIAASWPLLADAHRILAGATRSTRHLPRRVMLFAVAGAALMLAVIGISLQTRAPDVVRAIAARSIIGMLAGAAAVDALLAARRPNAHALGLRVLTFGYLALFVRQLFGVVSTIEAVQGGTIWIATTRIMQPATTVVLGLAFVVAVLLEERVAITEQSQALRAAQARQAVAQRLESLGRMAGGVAHDFANLLTVISAGLEYLREHASAPDTRDELASIEDAVCRAEGLTRQLRLFAREETATSETFDVGERAKGLDGVLRRLVGTSGRLVMTVDSTSKTDVRMDPSQFDQVLLNLVVNARDAVPADGLIDVGVGCISIDERNDRDLPGGEYVTVTVADSGPGIPAAVLPNIFEPFFTTKGALGTGLGLATVRSVVSRAGGTVSVDSSAAHGTRFEILLPASGVQRAA